MITVERFIQEAFKIQSKKPIYKPGGSGDGGTCDCIGLLIGAVRNGGGKYSGIHGSNYAMRKATTEVQSTSSGNLYVGAAIYKGKFPGESSYDLPGRYREGGSYYNGDLVDYYHVGIVISTNPLQIMHCTKTSKVDGITIDTKLGNWKWFGRFADVQYTSGNGGTPELQPEPTRQTLRNGATGSDVVYVQTFLQNGGYNIGRTGVDGKYGYSTQEAVKKFQKDSGLKADGIVGKDTWNAILSSSSPSLGTVMVTIDKIPEKDLDSFRKEMEGRGYIIFDISRG